MNISSSANHNNLYSVMPSKVKNIKRPITEADSVVNDKIKIVDKNAIDSHAEASNVVEHYEYQEAPWLKRKYDDPIREMCKEGLYILEMAGESSSNLKKINSIFTEFSDRLKDLRPDIASSNYGFTLDENANIKILDGRQPLTEADKLWLTDEINRFKDFRNTVHAHSKALMGFVDHAKNFDGKYNLNRHNFQSVIDYRDILNTSQHDFYERSLKMVRSYTPMRTEPRISTYA